MYSKRKKYINTAQMRKRSLFSRISIVFIRIPITTITTIYQGLAGIMGYSTPPCNWIKALCEHESHWAVGCPNESNREYWVPRWCRHLNVSNRSLWVHSLFVLYLFYTKFMRKRIMLIKCDKKQPRDFILIHRSLAKQFYRLDPGSKCVILIKCFVAMYS